LLLETHGDCTQRRRLNFVKATPRGAELIECAQKMIRVARDRFCDKRIFVIAVLTREFLSRDRKEKSKMFPQGNVDVAAAKQKFAQLRRGKKFHPKQRFALSKESTAEEIGLAA
jgi:hypothetical protein